MQSPEEKRAYREWQRKNYGEHFRYREKVKRLLKKGITDPDKYIAEENARKKELEERRELEREFPMLAIGRKIMERHAWEEAHADEIKAKKRLKESEDYLNRLIALEEKAKKNSVRTAPKDDADE